MGKGEWISQKVVIYKQQVMPINQLNNKATTLHNTKNDWFTACCLKNFSTYQVAILLFVDLSYYVSITEKTQVTGGRKYFSSRSACWPAVLYRISHYTTAHIKQYRHGKSFRTVTDYDVRRRGEQAGKGILLFTTTPRPTLWSFLTHQIMGRGGSFSGYKTVDIIDITEVCYAWLNQSLSSEDSVFCAVSIQFF